MTVYPCLKWVSHPGEPHDERFAGMSPADQSALEFALRQAERLGVGATAVTVGPTGADRVLRDALACGATRAVRIDAPTTGAVTATISGTGAALALLNAGSNNYTVTVTDAQSGSGGVTNLNAVDAATTGVASKCRSGTRARA